MNCSILVRSYYEWKEVLRSPPFWLMYVMFVMVGAGGLMATAQLAPIAKDFKIDNVPVSLLGITLPALTFALSIDRVLNGLTRPFFGWVSDHIGRENTMFIAFMLEGIGIYALLLVASNPLLFVILSGVVFFAWGEIYLLFPATCTDIYGRKFATTNYGMLPIVEGCFWQILFSISGIGCQALIDHPCRVHGSHRVRLNAPSMRGSDGTRPGTLLPSDTLM
jgi:MFS transporter, OFA family, oxalate/formate antiporter